MGVNFQAVDSAYQMINETEYNSIGKKWFANKLEIFEIVGFKNIFWHLRHLCESQA